MTELHAALAARVVGWGAGGYAHDRYPAIAEILRDAVDGEDPAQPFPASTCGRTRGTAASSSTRRRTRA